MTLTYERATQLVDYDPETGKFYWRTSRRGGKAGAIAGSHLKDGYWRLKIDGRDYRAGRLAWLLMTGSWPEHEIDHINRKRDDDRWANLRHVTRYENEENKALARGTGMRGIRPVRDRYVVRMGLEGHRIHLGTYRSKKDAQAVYRRAVDLFQPRAFQGTEEVRR